VSHSPKKVLRVRISEHNLARDSERLQSYGLGSCVALVLWDPHQKIGAMAHILLPSASNSGTREKSAKYASSAVSLLVEELVSAGCSPARLVAKIAGGATMFPRRFNVARKELGTNIGRRNVTAVRQALARKKIELLAAEVGGEIGRTIEFNPRNGQMIVSKSNGEVLII
jgi:chemotaxis protein CheD